jgi:serine/threonine protein kinase
MGAEIGRGGFAVVFQAFNVETGDFVAVKRFPLAAIDDESLTSIEVRYKQRFGFFSSVV